MYHMVHNQIVVPCGTSLDKRNLRKPKANREHLLEACLAAFVGAGTLDLSLDDLSRQVGSSKRMLIHYFGGRDALEELAMTRLEDRLRLRFRADAFPPETPLRTVILALWEQTTNPASRGVLLLVMDLTRRAWSGSERAKQFYAEQQRLWVDLLLAFSDDRKFVESLLQLFQGCVMAYLVTGDRALGTRALEWFVTAQDSSSV
jgi:AcrR family transcriptional regulator